MELNYYIGKVITQLPHILPLAEVMGGTIYTNDPITYAWLSRHKSHLRSKLIRDVSEIAPCNIVLADYFIFPPTFNRIQIFHGFSKKDYINDCPWKKYDVIINPSPHYKLPMQHAVGFSRYSLYSKQDVDVTQKGLCLYCPTHKLDNTKQLEELLKQYKVIVKFHPNDYRYNNPIIQQIKDLGVQVIDPTDLDYIEYQNLFKKVEVLASDFSSIAYEFTLTGKPIITPTGVVSEHTSWYHPNDIFSEIRKHLK